MTEQSTLEEIRARANKRAAVSDVRVDAPIGDSPLATYARHLERDRFDLLSLADRLRSALLPLVRIADAYDANGLDDEARKFWGKNGEVQNSSKPENVELYSGRGGRRLLTLADAFAARDALASEPPDQGAGVLADGYATSESDPRFRIRSAADLAPPAKLSPTFASVRSVISAVIDEARCKEGRIASPGEIAAALEERFAFGTSSSRSLAIAEMAEGLERIAARAAKLEAVYAALRTWPIFADGKEITPELVSQEGLDKVVLEGKFDANVDRLKACEAIALGEEGWEGLANECPSTLAVANLRREVQQLDAHVHDLLGQVHALENNAENAATAPIDFVDDEGTPGKLTWTEGDSSVGVQSGWSFDGVIVDGDVVDKLREAGKALLDDAKSAMHVMNDGWGVKVRWHYDDFSAALARLESRDERPIRVNETDAVTTALLGIGKAWSAFREGSVLGDSIGWGATREAAEADLRAKEELI